MAFRGAYFASLLLYAAIVSPCVGATSEPNRDAQVLAALNAKVGDAVRGGFGGTIIIDKAGQPLLRQGYGFADRAKRIPFTIDTVAQIGSVTKAMTALAVLELARDGKLDLQRPVKDYMPDAAEPAASATLHELLTHHAGLRDTCADDFDRVSRDDILHRCMALALAFPRGSDHYSNMGYSILAALVERVSSVSWEDYLRNHLWRPLGMAHTGFAYFDSGSRTDFASGYLNDTQQALINEKITSLDGNDWALRGNGGVQSSAIDMERFYFALTGKIPGIPTDVARAMTTPHEAMGGEAWEGYGLFVRLDAGNKPYRIGFSGSDGVFFSYFGWLPQQDVFFYVVGNNGEANVRPIVVDVLDAAKTIAGITPDMLQKPAQK